MLLAMFGLAFGVMCALYGAAAVAIVCSGAGEVRYV